MLAMVAGSVPTVSRILEVLGETVRSQQCILFLGAGVHAPPPEGSGFSYPPEQRPPIGSALSRELAAACDFEARFPGEDPGNLQRVALAYEIDSSRSRLVDALVDAVDVGKAPSPMLRALERLDFSLVITTNYDQLFERALREAGKAPRGRSTTPSLSRRRTFATRQSIVRSFTSYMAISPIASRWSSPMRTTSSL
jgi:hypothetical protein